MPCFFLGEKATGLGLKKYLPTVFTPPSKSETILVIVVHYWDKVTISHLDVFHFVCVYSSGAVLEHSDQKQLWEESIYLAFISDYIEEREGRNSRQELTQSLWRDSAYWLVFHLAQFASLYNLCLPNYYPKLQVDEDQPAHFLTGRFSFHEGE